MTAIYQIAEKGRSFGRGALLVALCIICINGLLIASAAATVMKDYCPLKMGTTRIVGTYFDFIGEGIKEDENDGLSTYILVPKKTERARTFFSVFFDETRPVTALRGAEDLQRDKFNVAYIPVKAVAFIWGVHRALVETHDPHYADFMADCVDGAYDYERAHVALVRLCARATNRPAFCDGDYLNGGPYLITVSCKGSRTSTAGNNRDIPCSSTSDWGESRGGISLDLAKFHEKAYRLLVRQYKLYVVQKEHLPEEWSILEPFRAKLVSAVLQASDILERSKSAEAAAIKFFGPEAAKDFK